MDYLYLNVGNKKEILERQIGQCEAQHYDTDLTVRALEKTEQKGQILDSLKSNLSLLDDTHKFLKEELASLLG